MWSSNSPWGFSGYSNQSRDVLQRLIKHGIKNIAMSCFYGLEGGIIDWEGVKCYPKIAQPYGTDALYRHSKDYKADVQFSLQDVWTMDPGMLNRLSMWVPYVPVDFDPCPKPIIDKLRFANRIISMSEFGRKALMDKGFSSYRIHHGVDTEIFKPMDGMQLRKKYDIPRDIFLFGMVSANKDNPPRKSFQQVIDAFAEFVKINPKSGLFFHSILQQQGGFNISNYAAYKGLSKHIYHIDPYEVMFKVDPEGIAQMMNMFDVLLMPSTNEGFGIPAIEAQSCGTPVIINNWTSMPELITKDTGLLTEVETLRWTNIQSFLAIPSPKSIYEAMKQLYEEQKGGKLKKRGENARKWVVENFDHDKIVKERWIPLLQDIARDVKR